MKNRGNRIITIEAPVSGLNLISAPNKIPLDQARELTNYVVTDAGIREFGKSIASDLVRPFARGLAKIYSNTGLEYILWSTNDGVNWDLRLSTTGSVANLNGAAIPYSAPATAPIQAGACINPVAHAGYVFYFSGGFRPGIRVNPNAPLAELSGFTINGGGVDTPLLSGTSFKGRLYAIEANTGGNILRYHYSALQAITGAMTAVDLGGVFRFGGQLVAITDWTFNPGDQNDQYLVIATTTGEILVYAGTDPGAANWGLVARLTVPPIYAYRPFVQVGAEMLVRTTRGVIALSGLLAGRGIDSPYVNYSKNIKDEVSAQNVTEDILSSGCWVPERSWVAFPEKYNAALPSGSQRGIYICNTERGAWSRIATKSADAIVNPVNLAQVISVNNTLIGLSIAPGKIYEISDGINTEFALWNTPFITGESNLKVNKVVAWLRGNRSALAVQLQAKIETEDAFDFATNNYDFQVVTAQSEIVLIDLNVGAVGELISVRTLASNSPATPQEIYSMQVWLEDTGSI